MAHADMIEVEGRVAEVLPGAKFIVDVPMASKPVSKPILCHLSGKLHINHIRILEGDRVTLEMSPYDLDRGRIVWRHK